MAMWADNVKFVKDIIDTKYNKIDAAIVEVTAVCNEENVETDNFRLQKVWNLCRKTQPATNPRNISILVCAHFSKYRRKISTYC